MHICSFGEQNDCGDSVLMVLFISLLTASIVTDGLIGLVPAPDAEDRRVLPARTVKKIKMCYL